MTKSRKRNEKIFKFFDQMRLTLKNEFDLKDDENLFSLSKLMEMGEGKEVREESSLSESIGQFDREFKKYVEGFKEMQIMFKIFQQVFATSLMIMCMLLIQLIVSKLKKQVFNWA